MTISLLIPCFNEEISIRRSIYSYLRQTRSPDQIVIVDDGSTDRSREIIAEFGDRVTLISLPANSGNKSRAQLAGLPHITGDICIMTDADSFLSKTFVEEIEKSFRDPSVASVAGYVKSLKYNWLTAARELEYILGQDIYKSAQRYINYIFIIPGSAAAFRTELFRSCIGFDHDTVTEDLDFTFKMHDVRKRIIFNLRAVVYTQDPVTIRSYINQAKRWYGGGWQNAIKHFHTLRNPIQIFEISLLYFENMMTSIIVLVMPFVYIKAFAGFIISHLVIAFLLGCYGSIKRKRIDLLLFFPAYTFTTLINAVVFFIQFVKEVVLRKKKIYWYRAERRIIVHTPVD